jgi:hypothetical protein
MYAAIWLFALAAIIGVGAYFAMLTGFMPYDDEGALMLSVKQYLGGMRIYEDVFSVYGPVYYFYNFLVRMVTFTPVTHEVTRISSLFPWLASSLLGSWISWRLTQSLVFAAAGLTLVSMAAVFFRSQPGHPQELTLLLLIAFVACPLLDFTRFRAASMILLGGLASALFLVKVNIGIFIAAALALALAARLPRTRMGRTAQYAAGAACLLLPAALMWRRLDTLWVRTYCLLVTASILACVICLLSKRHFRDSDCFSFRDIALAICGWTALAAATLAILTVQKVSASAISESLMLLPSRVFARNWFFSPGLSPLCAIWALAGIGLALVAVRNPTPVAWRRLVLFKAGFTVIALLLTCMQRDLLVFVTPFCWLVMIPQDRRNDEAQGFPRALLGISAVVQTLYGFPVYGSQGGFVQCLLLTVVAVCAGDTANWLTAHNTRTAWLMERHRALAATLLVVIAVANLAISINWYRKYRALPALDLPGAWLIHVERDQKEVLESLSRNIHRSCDVFESLPGLPSLNFWTERQPVTGLNSDAWTLYFSRQQQDRIIKALASHQQACAVYNPRLAAFWNPNHEDLSSLPLVRYLRDEFKPLMAAGEYQLFIRR